MANQKDKVSIFLTVIIVLLIVAMGVYAFVYREKIAETIQKFTKKENKEVYELRTTKKSGDLNEDLIHLPEKNKEEDMAFQNTKSEKNEKSKTLELPPVFEPVTPNPRSNLREKETEKKGNFPKLSELEDKFLDPAQSPYRKSTKITENPTEEELHSEFTKKESNSKKKAHTKKKKRYVAKTKAKSREKNTLEARVRELEEKFGIRPKKKSSLEKRISRLEQLEKRVDRLEKIASKKEE